MPCLCVFTLYFLVPVHSVRMEVNLGGKHRRTGVVLVWDVVALWVDAEIPLSASVKRQVTVFCCGSVNYRYM